MAADPELQAAFAPSRSALTPSEIVYLFGDRFVDDERPQTGNREPVLLGAGNVSTERLEVAVIRAAVIAGHETGVALLEWREDDLRDVVTQLAVIGPAGKLMGAVANTPWMQRLMDERVPHIEHVSATLDSWPAGTLESILAKPREATGLSSIVKHEFDGNASHSLQLVKDALAARGLISCRARAFGWLAPMCTATDATRRAAQARLPAVEAALNTIQTRDTDVWDALGRRITIALNAGFRG